MAKRFKVRIDGAETVLAYDSHSGARGHQYLTPGNACSHAFNDPLQDYLGDGWFETNGCRYEVLAELPEG